MRERYDWRIQPNMQLEYLLFTKVCLRLFMLLVKVRWVVDAVVCTVDGGVDGCCFITLGALSITVEVDTGVRGFMINEGIKTYVSFGDINV